MRALLIRSLVTAFLTLTAQAQTCTPEFIKAFETELHSKTSSTLSETVYDYACSKDHIDTGGQYGVISGYGKRVQEACAKHDKSFFQKNDMELATTFIPLAALQTIEKTCAPDGPVTLIANEVQGSISVKASFRPVGSIHQTHIKSFTYSSDIVRCKVINLKRDALLDNRGLGDTCKRLKSGPILFTLTSGENYQMFVLRAKEDSRYLLKLSYATDRMVCLLNGTIVAAMTKVDPNQEYDITDRVAPNYNLDQTVTCNIWPQNTAGMQDNWSYKYALYKGNRLLGERADKGNSSVVNQPVGIAFQGPQ